MKHGKWLRGMLMAGTVACVGCLTPIDQQPQASLDSAMHDDLPSTLAVKKSDKRDNSLLAKATEVENNEIISSPLQKQLAQLRKEATEQRQELSQCQDKYEELQRRSQELRSTLQSKEAKIAKVERVMRMIDDNPDSLDSVPLKAGSTLAMAAGNSNNNNGGFNLNDDEMPVLNDSPETADANNAWGKNSAETSSLAPAVDEHPAAPIAKKAGDVWSAPEASAPRPVKVILCDGEGAAANYIISRPVGGNMEKGMLFKADDDNIFVVTDVYATNAKARLHPRFAKGGVKNDTVLTPITTLP